MAMLFLHARIPVRWLMFRVGAQARRAVICQGTGYADDYLIVLRTYSAKSRRWQGCLGRNLKIFLGFLQHNGKNTNKKEH
jgi:hypothetical protein